MKTYEKNNLSKCNKCGDMVGTETLIRQPEWNICENCWDAL